MWALVEEAFRAPQPVIPARAANARGRIAAAVAEAAERVTREVEVRIGAWDAHAFRRGVTLQGFCAILQACNEHAAANADHVSCTDWMLSIDSYLKDCPGVRVTTAEPGDVCNTLKVPAGDGVLVGARAAARVALSFERPALGHLPKVAPLARVRAKVRKSFTIGGMWRIDLTRVWERAGATARSAVDADFARHAPPSTLEVEVEFVGPADTWHNEASRAAFATALGLVGMSMDGCVVKSFQ